jgi:protein TonB
VPRAALLSLGAHAAVALILFGGIFLPARRLPDPPDQHAEVEIVIGSNARQNGAPASPPVPAEATPTPPVPEAEPKPSPPAPTDQQALGPPPLPAEPDPASVPMPRPAGKPTEQAAAPPPPRPSPPRPQEAPAQTAKAAPSTAEIHVGDGVAASFAEIEGAGSVRKAEGESDNQAPTYPLEAARRREHGTVVLRIFIDVDGSVSQVQILHSSGSPILDGAARDRVKTWHFRPAIINGIPVPDMQEQNISFVLD